MITVYSKTKKGVLQTQIMPGEELPDHTIWIDLDGPTIEEEKFIEGLFKIDAPTREEIEKIEVRSPFYEQNGAHHMTITALENPNYGYPFSSAVTFILKNEIIITLRHTNPAAFKMFISLIMLKPKHYFSSSEVALIGVLDCFINKIADVLDNIGSELDLLLQGVFEKNKRHIPGNNNEYYNGVISQIGRLANLISKNRESLVSINRLIMYFGQIEGAKYMNVKDFRLRTKHLLQEVSSLSEYANFISQRYTFLLDATLGLISVEQNMIIKAFTVAAMVFMPPTLIASVYGMNFKNMPELQSTFGYPVIIVVIIVSAIIPYYYFKRKKWI